MNIQVDIPQIAALRAELEVQPVASLHPSTRMAYTIFHPYGGVAITPNGSPNRYSLDYSRYAGGQQRSDRIPMHVPEGCRAILYFSGFDPNDIRVSTVDGSRVTGDFEGEFERPGPICNEGADPVADDIYTRMLKVADGTTRRELIILSTAARQLRQRHPHQVWLEGLGAFGSPANIPAIA